VIFNWKKVGGVLLMGYELYRLLATRTQRKKRKTKKEAAGPVYIDIEEEDKEKLILEGLV
jgi:RAD54-like protein 2